ncbi:MAG: hypothetical protein HYZ47_04485 [Simkania negevensis]|nr:hypothetical protein [Simkania negevensis]
MLRKLSILSIIGVATLFYSCESKTGTGVLAGGALGAGIGGIAGGGQGALIGGAAGVIAGGLIGASLDEQDRKNLDNQNSQTLKRVDKGEQLSVNDIINMHKAEISDQKIMDLIDKTGSHYTLNNYQVDRLREAGVSEKVINYMMYNT